MEKELLFKIAYSLYFIELFIISYGKYRLSTLFAVSYFKDLDYNSVKNKTKQQARPHQPYILAKRNNETNMNMGSQMMINAMKINKALKGVWVYREPG